MATIPALEWQDPAYIRHAERLQVHFLYSHSTVTFIFPVLAGAALCLLLRSVSPAPVLYTWYGVVLAYSAYRFRLLWRFRTAVPREPECGYWHAALAMNVLFSGVLWGLAPIVLIRYEPDRLVEFTLYNGLIVLIISGLAAGAVIAYATSLRVLFSYVVPALVPPALYLISLGDRYNSTLGGFTLLYFVFIAATAARVRHHFGRLIRLEQRAERMRHEIDCLRRRAADPGGRGGIAASSP